VIGWGIEALIASAVLMAIVLVIRGPVRRSFGPSVAYALWALPVIRLMLPPLPQLPAWKSAAAVVATPDLTQTLTVYVIEPLGGSAAAPASLVSSLGLPLAVLWGVGAAAFLGWHAISHMRFCRRMIAGSTLSERAGAIDVIETEEASGPLAFGIFRRYVAFPRDFAERYDADERELALLHELGHHQRGDLVANWIALGVLALHWFNPLAWRAFRAYRADQEMANDARVLAGRSAIDRHAYACAIVKAAHGGAVSAACHLHTINDLKGRLKMLTTGPRSRTRMALGGTAVAALMIAGLAATASGTAAAASVRAGVEKATGIDIAKLDAKLQSAPPAPPATPEGATIPAAPEAPEVPSATPPSVDRDAIPAGAVRKIKIVKMDKDGKVLSEQIQGIPEVSSVNCDRDGKGGRPGEEMVVNKIQNGRRAIVICTDRIERVAEAGAREASRAGEIQRKAYASALAGLRNARAGIVNDRSMTAEARDGALEGIDESISELESDLSELN